MSAMSENDLLVIMLLLTAAYCLRCSKYLVPKAFDPFTEYNYEHYGFSVIFTNFRPYVHNCSSTALFKSDQWLSSAMTNLLGVCGIHCSSIKVTVT